MIYLSDMYWRFKILLPSTLFSPKLFPNMQKKNSWEKHKNSGGFKAWHSWRHQGREEVTNQTELGESANIHVASAEVASQGVELPTCLRECFHLLDCICLKLCLMLMSLLDLRFLCFFYLYISWILWSGGSVFFPLGLRERRWCYALICIFIRPYIFLSFCFLFVFFLFFFFFFLFSPHFFPRALAVCFSWSRSQTALASEIIWNNFFLIWNCSDFLFSKE